MNMMLLAMLAAVVLGIFVRKFDRRELTLAAVTAVGLTVVYYFRPLTMT
jgi:hypothetical protein